MGLREDIEAEDARFIHKLKAEVQAADDIEQVLFELQQESKREQEKIFRKHHYGEPVILKFPDSQPPRAA